MAAPRYKVIPPIPHGEAFWLVIEPASSVMENFAVASLSIHCPNAEAEALALCARLNDPEFRLASASQQIRSFGEKILRAAQDLKEGKS